MFSLTSSFSPSCVSILHLDIFELTFNTGEQNYHDNSFTTTKNMVEQVIMKFGMGANSSTSNPSLLLMGSVNLPKDT